MITPKRISNLTLERDTYLIVVPLNYEQKDGNNDIQAFDASLVLQYVVRLIDRFLVQIDDNLNPPTDPKNHPFLKPVPLDRIIALGKLQLQTDGTYLMPINLSGPFHK